MIQHVGGGLSAGDPDAVAAFVRALVLGGAGLASPLVGSLATFVDALLAGRASKLVEARIEQFREELRAQFSRMLPADAESRQFAELHHALCWSGVRGWRAVGSGLGVRW